MDKYERNMRMMELMDFLMPLLIIQNELLDENYSIERIKIELQGAIDHVEGLIKAS